jgi:transcriptional regulator with XRE-family HTH domain
MPKVTPSICPGPDQPADLSGFELSGATSFGTAVLALRNRLGKSQSAVATAARLAAGYYSDIENNRRPAPPRPTALRIAAALSLAPEQAACLAGLADVERAAVRTDAHLAPEVRALLRAVRLAAPRLTPAAVSRVRQALQECCE